MKISAFAVDEDAEVNGTWVPLDGGGSILVARSGNTKYSKLLRELTSQYTTASGRTSLANEEAKRIIISVEAQTILLGWKDMEDDTGIVEYSVQTAILWLTTYKEFRKIVHIIADEVAYFRAEKIVEVKENLKK